MPEPTSASLPVRVLLTVLLVPALAACGGSSSEEAKPGPDVSASADESPSAADSETPRPTKSPEPTEPADPSDEPTDTGTAFGMDGLGFDAPRGWRDATARFQSLQPQIDLAVVEPDVADGFADNVNVIVTPWPRSLAGLEKQGLKELASVAEGAAIQERTTIGGEPAAHVTAVVTAGRTKVASDQFYAVRDGQATIITFSVESRKSPAQRQEVIDAVLDSWVWTAR